VLEAELRELQREEEAAASEVRQRKEIRRLDEQVAALHALNLPPAALTAARTALDRERAELLAQASGSRAPRINRAKELRARMPQIAAAYEKLIENGLKALTGERAVSAAREAVRKLLEDGRIILTPDADHGALTGMVRFVDLGHHIWSWPARDGTSSACKIQW
jgi:hypothetical protein